MKIEQPIPLGPRLDHSVASRHHGVAQEDIHLVAASKNKIRSKWNIYRRRSFIEHRTDGARQLHCSRRFIGADPKDHGNRSDLNLISGLKGSSTGNTIPVDRGAALAAKVFNEPCFAFQENPAMAARYFRMAEHQINFRCAANDDIFATQEFRAWWEPGENRDRRFQVVGCYLIEQ
ncbi:MAG: hypothetical protein QOH78_15 [Verrucomicrobiota bacterium]